MVLNLVADEATVPSYITTTTLVANLLALAVPLLVNLITKSSASDGLRAVVNIVATAVLSALALWANPSGVDVTWQLAAYTFLSSLVTSFTAYKAIWKPTGVSGSVVAASSGFGLGSPPAVETASKGAEDMGQVDNDPRA